MICFFCLQCLPSSVEHVFPQAIGGTLTTDRVCKPCKDYLGHTVDTLVTNHILIQFRRSALALAGQKGTIPNALEILLRRSVMIDDPEQRVGLVTNSTTGELQPRILPKKTTWISEDGRRQERMVVDASTSTEDIKRVIIRFHKREGLPPLSGEDLEKIIAKVRSNVVTVEQPEVKGSVQVDLTDYKRGVLKIAYELACTWLGDEYLADPMAATFRDVILGRIPIEDAKIQGTADFVRPGAFRFWPANQDTHIAYAMIVDGNILIAVKLFETFFMVAQVSGRGGFYDVQDFDAPNLRFIEITTPTGKRRESSLIEELARRSSA